MLDRVLVNWPLKLLSLALAFAIWVFVSGEKSMVRDFAVPLEIRLPENRILTTAPPTTVTVRVRGPESLMRRLDRVPIGLGVDLGDPPAGQQEVQLSKADLDGLPRGVEIDFIDPDRLRLEVDVRASREIAVEPTFLGQPPEGYAFYGVQVVPDTVLVEGPESAVAELDILRTNPIRLDRRTEPFVARVQAIPTDGEVRVADPRPLEVRVVVDASPVERTFEHIPVELVGQLYEAVVSPAALNVTLAGPPALVERIVPAQIRLVADATGLEPRDKAYEVGVQFDLVDVPIEEMTRIGLKSISRRRITIRVADRRIVR